jgi:alpha-1,6-mannosyltransferase
VRIVQLANFHSPTSGGLRVAVDTLRAGYLAAGHDCTLIVPGTLDATRDTVRTLRSPRLGDTGYRVIVRRRAVLTLLDNLRPDVLEVHDKLLLRWVWRWSRLRGVPVVAWSHERLGRTLPLLLPSVPDTVVRQGAARIARHTAGACDVLIACSRFAADEFPPYAPVRIVPLGVDLDAFRPPVAAPPPDRLRLVLTARLSPEKRPELAVDALRVLRERGVAAELTVLGSGPRQARLARYARGLPVRFTGHLCGRERVAAELGAADVALAPAPAETFGLAALEALACGTPIVAHAGAAPAELVGKDQGAGAVATGDALAFAAAALRLAQIPRETRRDAARRAAEAYPWSATTAAMLAVHADVMSAPLPRPQVYAVDA